VALKCAHAEHQTARQEISKATGWRGKNLTLTAELCWHEMTRQEPPNNPERGHKAPECLTYALLVAQRAQAATNKPAQQSTQQLSLSERVSHSRYRPWLPVMCTDRSQQTARKEIHKADECSSQLHNDHRHDGQWCAQTGAIKECRKAAGCLTNGLTK
jgi:hypothetical protein